MAHAQEAIRIDGNCLAFCSHRRDLFRIDRGGDELMCPCSDEDLARCGGLFEPGRHIDGITRDQRLTDPRDDLARVHARSGGKTYTVVARQVVV